MKKISLSLLSLTHLGDENNTLHGRRWLASNGCGRMHVDMGFNDLAGGEHVAADSSLKHKSDILCNTLICFLCREDGGKEINKSLVFNPC